MAFFNFKNYNQSKWKRPVPQMGDDDVYSNRDPLPTRYTDIPIYPYQEFVLPLQEYAGGVIPPVFDGIELPEFIKINGTNLIITVPGNIGELANEQGDIDIEIDAEN